MSEHPSSEGWGGEDSNLRPADYEPHGSRVWRVQLAPAARGAIGETARGFPTALHVLDSTFLPHPYLVTQHLQLR
jgi:hypothetical protein